MCVTSIQTSPGCDCKVVRNFVCQKRIDHTWLQKDDEACPDLDVRNIETFESDCLRDPMTPCKDENHHSFESHPSQSRRVHENKFLEKCTDDFADCFDGKFRYGFQHGCGIGLAMDRQKKWRHVNYLVRDEHIEDEIKELYNYTMEDDSKEENPFADAAEDTEMDDMEDDDKENIDTSVETMEK